MRRDLIVNNGFFKDYTYINVLKCTCLKTKLALTIEERVIETAKKYVKIKGKILSGFVENYLRVLTVEENPASEWTPRLRRLRGCVKWPDGFYNKEALEEDIANKCLN